MGWGLGVSRRRDRNALANSELLTHHPRREPPNPNRPDTSRRCAQHDRGGDLPRQRRRRIDRLLDLRRIPLVAALEAFAEIAASLRRLHLSADEPTLRTLLVDRLVPRDEITVVIRTCIKCRSAFLRAAFDELTAVFRAEHARRHRASAPTLREGAAAEELAAPPLPNDHRLTADVTLVLRHHGLRLLALDGTRVLARLRM